MQKSLVKRVILILWRSATIIKDAFSHLTSQNKIALVKHGASLEGFAMRWGGRLSSISFMLLMAIAILFAGFYWVGLPVSDKELLANFSKAENFYQGLIDQTGFPWWSPMYLQGTSLAFAWVFMATNVSLLAFSIPFGFLIGPKIASIFLVWLGSLGSFCFLARYSKNQICAWIGGAFFAFCPSVLTRAASFEHYAVLLPMALLPWLLWSVLAFVHRPSCRCSVGLGLVFSLVLLSYTKAGLMAFLVAVAFGAVEFFSMSRSARPEWRLVAIAAGVVVLLAVVPNLPALRESSFVAMFEFGPFAGWQRAFSTKSALSWFDRDGFLGAGMLESFAPTTQNGGTYLGFVTAALLVALLAQARARISLEGKRARTMMALALGMFWLSFGPHSVTGGHFEFLRMSPGAADLTPAIGWFLLAAQIWVIFRLVPDESTKWRWIAAVLSLVYLFVPGFRVLECLPLYSNIRAPFDFYQVVGAVCMVLAVGLAAGALLKEVCRIWIRWAAVVALVLLAALDVSVYAKPFFTPKMERAVWADFLEAQEFLKSSPKPGRVYPFSGRYFYLMTPWLSGRPVAAEAFNSYLQQRPAAVLQASAFLSDEQLEAYFRVAGVAYLLLDKTDPDTTSKQLEQLRKMCPVAFENTNIAVLEVKNPLGYAFLARDFIQTSSDGPETAVAALGGAAHNLAVIQTAGGETAEPGLRGRVVDGHIAQREGEVLDEGRAFQPVKKTGKSNYQRVEFEPTGETGWLIFNEAWHPDWRAREAGKEIPLSKGLLAFSAVRTDGKSPVVFEFQPPWWYAWCAWVAVAGWFAALVYLALGVRPGGDRSERAEA